MKTIFVISMKAGNVSSYFDGISTTQIFNAPVFGFNPFSAQHFDSYESAQEKLIELFHTYHNGGLFQIEKFFKLN